MSEKKGFFELLMDFSFQQSMTARFANLLYALHLLVGLIVAVWQVFNGFQVSTTQGLLVLLLAVVAYFFWILYVRICLEFLVAVFRTADAIIRTSGGSRES
jgi:fatty acid desaturase